MLDPTTLKSPSRRQVVKGAAVATTMATLATTAGAQSGQVGGQKNFGLPSTLPTERQLQLALFERASFGYTEDDFAVLESLGYEAWLDAQLDPMSIDDSDLDNRLVPYDWVSMTVEEMANHPTLDEWEIAVESRPVRMLRAVFSKRQLFERMVEFWTDHFNIYAQSSAVWTKKPVDDREVIRTHALGTFQDLLRASGTSPAMLAYLDNDTNRVGAPQENYAREVMELHSLGSDGPYTENDVREVARCFTGWGFTRPWMDGDEGLFNFRADHHDDEQKVVLGTTIPAGGGVQDGFTVLDILATHPKTIDYVTRKMASWLLGYEAPERSIRAAKQRWVSTNGDIKEVVKALLSRQSFMAAAPWERKKLKRPFHWICSVFRASGVDMPEPHNTLWKISGIGQIPFQWRSPDGYPDTAEAWASSLLQRWRESALFFRGGYWSTNHSVDDMRALLQGAPKAEWAQRINMILAGGSMDTYEVEKIQTYLDTFDQESNQAVTEAFELGASSPSFQTY